MPAYPGCPGKETTGVCLLSDKQCLLLYNHWSLSVTKGTTVLLLKFITVLNADDFQNLPSDTAINVQQSH